MELLDDDEKYKIKIKPYYSKVHIRNNNFVINIKHYEWFFL